MENRFFRKLNYNVTIPHQIEEEIKVTGGSYNSILKHDNVEKDSIIVLDKDGYPVENVSFSDTDKEWETFINIYTTSPEITIKYTSYGDTVDADDVNEIYDYLEGIDVDIEWDEIVNKPDFSVYLLKSELFNEINRETLEYLQYNNKIDLATKLKEFSTVKDTNELNKKLDDFVKNTNTLIQSINDEIAEIKKNHTNLVGRVDTIDNKKADKTDVDSKIDNINSSISQTNSKVNKNTTDINNLTSQKADKSYVDQQDKLITDRVTSLEGNTGDLNTETNKMKNDISKLQKDKADKTEIPKKLSDLTDDTLSKPVKYSERVKITDTRNVDDTPLEIMKSGASSLMFDFKLRKNVGSPGVDISANNSYAHILTVYGWTDNTGGYPTQISFGSEKVGIRTGTSNDTWSSWRKYSDDSVIMTDVRDLLKDKMDKTATGDDIKFSKSESKTISTYVNELKTKLEKDIAGLKVSTKDLQDISNKLVKDMDTKVSKSGDTIKGSLNVVNDGFPVVRMERVSSAQGNRYGAANLVRSGTTKPVDGIGIGFYFKNPNSSATETHSGFFGGALDSVASGSEVGQIVISPAWKGQDPYARKDFTITAISDKSAKANLEGKLTTYETLDTDSKDTVATKGYVDAMASGGMEDKIEELERKLLQMESALEKPTTWKDLKEGYKWKDLR